MQEWERSEMSMSMSEKFRAGQFSSKELERVRVCKSWERVRADKIEFERVKIGLRR